MEFSVIFFSFLSEEKREAALEMSIVDFSER